MKEKFLLMILFLVVISQSVYADSTISGWILVPDSVKLGDYSIEINDISITKGEVFAIFEGKGMHREYVIPVGKEIKADNISLTYWKLISGERTYILTTIHFPYLLEGQSISFGEYQILLFSTNENKTSLRVYGKEESKDLTVKSGESIKFENLEISAVSRPEIFNGFLIKDEEYRIGDWKLKFIDYNVTNENGTLIERAKIEINGNTFELKKGQTVEADGGILTIDDFIGEKYLKVHFVIKGAYLHINVLPDYHISLSVGKTTKLGPYLVNVENVFGNEAYISILNPCGKPINSALLVPNTIGAGLYYNGLVIGVLNISSGEERKVELIGFLNEKDVPKLEEYALLNITLLAPKNVNQYERFTSYIYLKNDGKVDLNFLQITPVLSQDFEIVGTYPTFLEELKVGETQKIPIELKALKGGSLYLGQIKVSAYAQFELACKGFEKIEFTSNEDWINVNEYKPKYVTVINTADGKVGDKIKVNVTVRSFSNFDVPFTLSVALPKEFAIYTTDFTKINGNILYVTDTLSTNSSKTYTFTMIPNKVGEFTIETSLESKGNFFKNHTTFKVYPNNPSTNSPSSTATPTSNSSKISTTTITQTMEKTTTVSKIVVQNTTVVPLKSKLLFSGGGFVSGVAFILLLAYIAAKLEERREKS
ncbi:hypothetical protein PAP_04485 [Palaeococcus pacificus DY20341]|uniref:CARDB domain-containing protein n=1 Tax=Palaeococcus pacificus DY20341 TaxID=1343739 RepID=A0A075LXM4_9EURY|nr:BatD family protein [Palaeococcus pacificus]AIF69308.1 hypothetical protein PAP_04485 [Palaeococcus pacificus DY20341]